VKREPSCQKKMQVELNKIVGLSKCTP
jgi:hypothetical protein